jgi:hypothetical protein
MLSPAQKAKVNNEPITLDIYASKQYTVWSGRIE